MNRKTIIAAIISAALLLPLIGCGNNDIAANGDSSNNNRNNNFQQQNFDRADLQGQITAVKGNKITIKVIKNPEFNRNRNGNGNFQRPSGTIPPRNSIRSNNQISNARNGNQASRQKLEFTGEVKSYTITDKVEITFFKRTDKGMETEKLSTKDLKKDSVIQIWLSKDKKSVEKLRLQFSRNNL